jgi:calpain-7
LKAAGASKIPAEKSRLKQKCNDLISLAERLKKIAKAGDSVSIVEKRLKLPRIVRQLPTSEKNILLRGSKLHGSIFPPWESDPDPDDFTGTPFSDTVDFPLSGRQKSVFAGWKRSTELVGPTGNDADQGNLRRSLMEAEQDYDLVQDITTDCSVVASLCASIKHLQPGPYSILSALMFPVDSDQGQPKVSSNGKYVFRMYFNGCFRKVIIDDRLPSSSNSRTLYVVDRQNPRLIWPALMEKAYLKVRGGYDFPGSNSGTDLWVLTGWIPQQIFLQSDDIDFGQTWSRVKKAYDYGDVVVTLGTGRLSELEEDTLGLAGEHDYAVLDISETPGSRKLLVKNPWCDGMVWKGVGSSNSSSAADHPTKLKPGSFWISFDDVAQNFESLYLNWNPALFTERQDHHFVWRLPEPTMLGSFAHNPQYFMTASADGSTWILLSRHFQDQELAIAKSRSSTTLADVSNKLGFMSLSIFDNKGARVQLGDKSLYRGHFVDSPQTLAPFEAKKGVRYTIAVAQHGLPLPQYSFTLSVFSRGPLDVGPAQDSMSSHTETQGSWTRRTAGGNAASATYLQNPQFAISVPQAGPLSILLSTDKEDLPVHVDLVWAKGQRVTALTIRDLVATSGEYRRGCALATVLPSVDAGVYTVVCSTFEPNQFADFTLRVGSMVPVTVTPVAADAAGRLRTALPPLFFRGPEDGNKKRAEVSAVRLTKASVVVTSPLRPQHHTSSGHPSSSASSYISSNLSSLSLSSTSSARSHNPTVRLRLELGRGPNREVLASTGGDEFKEVGVGLRTAEFDVDPRVARGRGLWIVVEQIGSYPQQTVDEAGGLNVELLSEGTVRVGGWEVVDE